MHSPIGHGRLSITPYGDWVYTDDGKTPIHSHRPVHLAQAMTRPAQQGQRAGKLDAQIFQESEFRVLFRLFVRQSILGSAFSASFVGSRVRPHCLFGATHGVRQLDVQDRISQSDFNQSAVGIFDWDLPRNTTTPYMVAVLVDLLSPVTCLDGWYNYDD